LKILLLGGEGFIGRYFSSFLRERGHEVDVIDFLFDANQDLRFLKIENLDLYDRVYFLAWDVGGSKYLTNRGSHLEQFESNLRLMNNVFPQLKQSQVPYLFVSSQLAGSDSTPYSLTKLTGEIISSHHESAWRVRQWNVYGAFEKEGIKSHVITDMIAQAVRTKRINLLTTGEERRQFIHIEDVCSAYLNIFSHSNREIYNVTSNRWDSILEVAQIIAELTDSQVKCGEVLGANPKANPGAPLPDWSSRVSLEEGIEQLLRNFLN
jgi:nucleoside-diphosphate-sugar epimerase